MPALSRRILIVCLFSGPLVFGQVDEIKSASSSRGGRGESSRGGAGGASGYDLFFMFGYLIDWQQYKLDKKEEVRSIVSLDIMLQTAVQPSSYYIIHPRIRANWGLFSTDFRLNYLVEEDIDGVKYLRTTDWQVLQLNLVTTRDVTFRVGAGMIQESFGGKNNYGEWTAGFHLKPSVRPLGGVVEYRGSEVRSEFNAHLQYNIFNKQRLHGYLTGGGVYQRYYNSIHVWGFQGGLSFSIY
jgi:hypothetical protein